MKFFKKNKILCVLCTAVIMISILATTVMAKSVNYKDVKETDWFYASVMDVQERGIMAGYSNEVFGAKDVLTRCQFAAILHRMEGKPEASAEAPFKDVKEGAYYEKAVDWAYENNIIKGYSDTKFGVDDSLTREQMVTIMFRYANMKGVDTSARGDYSKFKDADKISNYAKEAIKWSIAEGIISGRSETILEPEGKVTRAQCAAIISRYLKSQEKVYSIIYNLDGGSVEKENPVRYTKSTKTFTLNNPVKEGYTFAGWAGTGLAEASTTVMIEKGSEGNKIFKATWKANEYEVNYDGNGADNGSMTSDVFTYDSEKTLKENAFEKTGYTFNGWNTKADGTGVSYTDKQSVKNLVTSGSVTLYAQWVDKNGEKPDDPVVETFNIIYNLQGGAVTKENPATYTNETETFTLNNPEKEGYTFAGWIGSNGLDAQKTVKVEKGSEGNKTYTATWTANVYTVKFDGNGATSGTMTDETFTYDETKALKENVFVRTGYTFGGWNTKKDGSGISYTDKQSVRNLVTSGKVTLYAQWVLVEDKPHEHVWKEKTETIHHEEVGYYEEYVIKPAWTEKIPVYGWLYHFVCDQCGAEFDFGADIQKHFDDSWQDALDGKISFSDTCYSKTATPKGEQGIIAYDYIEHPAEWVLDMLR